VDLVIVLYPEPVGELGGVRSDCSQRNTGGAYIGVLEIDVAQAAVDGESIDRVSGQLEFETLHLGCADVARLLAWDRRARRQLQDDVVILIVEGGAVQAQAAIEKVRLEPDLVSCDRLRIERTQLVAGGGGHVARCIALTGRWTEEWTRVHAAAFEACRDRRVDEKLVGEAVVGRSTPVPAIAFERVGNSEKPCQQAVGRVADGGRHAWNGYLRKA